MACEPQKEFACSSCGFTSPYVCFGRSLQSGVVGDTEPAGRIVFLEDCYLLPDPNAVRVHPLNVGSHCSLCDRVICVSEACSIFYAKRFCASCAKANESAFPAQCKKLAPKIFGQAQAIRNR